MPTPEKITFVDHNGDVMITLPDLDDFYLLVHLIGAGYATVLVQTCCGKSWYMARRTRCLECYTMLSDGHLDSNGEGTKASIFQWMGEHYTNSLAAELWTHEMLAGLDELVVCLGEKSARRKVLAEWSDRAFPVM